MSTLPGLSVLDVSCNPKLAQEVDDSGFRELAASLSHTASLTVLRLQGCGLTADCLHSLGRRTVFMKQGCTVEVFTCYSGGMVY